MRSKPLAGGPRSVFYCVNAGHSACNWLVQGAGSLCDACKLNRTIPDSTQAENLRLSAPDRSGEAPACL